MRIPVSKAVLAVAFVLVVQTVVFYGTTTKEYVPDVQALADFPRVVGQWSTYREGVIDQETQDFLKADDALTRFYVTSGSPRAVNLFVAFFKTQRAGVQPHSPKVCLPGSGWTPSESSVIAVEVPGRAEPIHINRYVVSRGGQKSIVMYWYQTWNRVVANEYSAKLYLILDSMRYHRSDTSIVRVTVPLFAPDDQTADQVAIEFIQSMFQPIKEYLPGLAREDSPGSPGDAT